jgi:folylpolyglutamate synthase/dihydropteroate synthase
VVACLAILADKDAKAMIEALAPALTQVVCTQLPESPADGPKGQRMDRFPAHRPSFSAKELVRVCRDAGVGAEGEADFAAAIRRARALALELDGALLVTGSHYVLAPARAALRLCEDSADGLGH